MTVRLLGAGELRQLAAELDLAPTKRLGQNFVHDPGTVRRIVATAQLQPGEQVLEIGPGLGSLTLGLLEAGASVTAVEIDSRLAARLPRTAEELAPGSALRVVHADALHVSAAAVGEPVALVANLPYNVSVPVLLHLLAELPSLRRGVVMVQAEVGERLAAGPGSKTYGVPSVKAAWYGAWRLAGGVGRSVFWPVPNVDSVLVAFAAHEQQPGEDAVRGRVFELVDIAFGQRRKMLRQVLAGRYGGSQQASAVLARAGIDPTVRGESLALADFRRLAIAESTAATSASVEP